MKVVVTLDIVDRIFELADARFKEQKDFAQAIGFFPSKVSEWKARKSKSYQKRLPKIAEVLGTSVDYLLTGEKKELTTIPGSEPDESTLDFMNALRQLDAEDLELIKAQVEVMLRRKQKP